MKAFVLGQNIVYPISSVCMTTAKTIEPQRDDTPYPRADIESMDEAPWGGISLDVFWARLDPPTA